MTELIIDGHLDLAFNAIQLRRDLTQPALTIRSHDPPSILRSFGSATVGLPELAAGGVGIVFATAMSRIDPRDTWTRTGMYVQQQCHAVARGHYAYYEALERAGAVSILRTRSELRKAADTWRRHEKTAAPPPIGLVLTMESADPILGPDDVEAWHARGLRMVSLSHYGEGHYACGTGTEGGLKAPAGDLLEALRRCRVIVDLTHTTDQGFWETLERYDGPVAASHHNCRALVPGQRQLTDPMIRAIAARDGVIGAAFDVWMLDPSWDRTRPARAQATAATLSSVVDQIDHVCQLTGNSLHAAIGTDLDGGYGQEQSPRDLNTIADLAGLSQLLRGRGYTAQDLRRILSENWLRLLEAIFPDSRD